MKYICGFFMALADSVPGVSGGTIAFIFGLYDEFIKSVSSLIFGSMPEKINAMKFLGRLGLGWIVGFVMAIIVLTSLFQTYIYQVSSLFIGFTVFTIVIVLGEEKDSVNGNMRYLPYTVFGALLVITITAYNTYLTGGNNIDLTAMSPLIYIYVLFVAMVAISAMILPGISGSTLLMIFGLYIPIITELKKVLSFDFTNIIVIIVFCLGLVLGMATSISLVKTALAKYRSQAVYTILGMVVGSTYAIVQGPTTIKMPAMTFSDFHIMYFILGMAMLAVLQRFKTKRENM